MNFRDITDRYTNKLIFKDIDAGIDLFNELKIFCHTFNKKKSL